MRHSNTRRLSAIVVISAIFFCATTLAAGTFTATDNCIGAPQRYKVQRNDSLIEIARSFDLGFNEIADANPGVDPFVPKVGTVITIPSAWILPVVPMRPSIVINIPELRLYYFPKRGNAIFTFPLGIGDEGRDTPLGSYRIIEKITHPPWYVPRSIRAERPGLPEVMPPGPGNPMGSHALRLSLKSILIHGTDRPWGIGRRTSHGCLRLYPEDIKQLFRLVPKGMRVAIIDQPFKVAARGGAVFVESHRYKRKAPGVPEALRLLAQRKLLVRTDFAKLVRAIEESRGYPVDVTLRR